MPNSCLSDTELVMAIDGELSPAEQRKAEIHLQACWRCRTRRAEFERSVEDFVRWHESVPVPPPDGPRAMLRAQMSQASVQISGPGRWLRLGYLGAAALAGALAGILVWTASGKLTAGTPDPRTTPGVALPVTLTQVCQHEFADEDRPIPEALARQVFKMYGINNPGAGKYEVDYLITPALGGAEDVRNMWPQPYSSGVWNAHVKDALEDRLHEQVCSGQISLSAAQRELAENWVAAYQRYFQTSDPLAAHLHFVKDKPWN